MVSQTFNSMPSPGGKFLGGYRHFVGRFITGYLLLACAVLVALLLIDAIVPDARVYGRVRDLLRLLVP